MRGEKEAEEKEREHEAKQRKEKERRRMEKNGLEHDARRVTQKKQKYTPNEFLTDHIRILVPTLLCAMPARCLCDTSVITTQVRTKCCSTLPRKTCAMLSHDIIDDNAANATMRTTTILTNKNYHKRKQHQQHTTSLHYLPHLFAAASEACMSKCETLNQNS